jgi:hypothetical protein
MTQARLTDRRKVDIDTRTQRYINLVKISFPLVEPTWRPSGRPQLNVILNMSGVQLLLASFSGVRFEAGVNFLGHRAAQLASYLLCFWNSQRSELPLGDFELKGNAESGKNVACPKTWRSIRDTWLVPR